MVEFVDMLKNATITLPAVEVAIMMITMSFCLLVRYPKVGLIAAYIFAYKWGWMFINKQSPNFLVAYLAFGFIIGLLGVICMLRPQKAS
jgi:hypothetical protein